MDNSNKYKDLEYMNLVDDILEHEEFKKTKNITHHGLNRFDHCLRVSYYSYKVSKLLKLGYKDVARAGLLHDFFFVDNSGVDTTKRLDVLINHPKYALINSKRYFELTEKEENIITSHMFPVALKAPRYAESWIVDLVDNIVAVCEALYMTRKHLTVAANFLIIVVLNYWR
jgi:uncharacterized protein